MEMVIKEFSREIINNGESSALFYQSFKNLVKGRFLKQEYFFRICKNYNINSGL